MQFTNEQMDVAIDRWRKMSSVEQLYADLAQDAEFKAALEAAAERAFRSGDPKQRFWEVDAEGWTPTMFNRPIPPARPPTTSWLEDPAFVKKFTRTKDSPFPTY
jgi:hypothetical protein